MRLRVSLASDHLGTYAVLLPIAAKLWETLGYTPIVQHSLRDDNPFEQAVLAWTVGDKYRIAAREPLSLPNTMRAVRLFAWELADSGDFILTADVDMFPLSRTFFADPPPHVLLRACWYLWLGNEGREPFFDPARLEPTGDPSCPYRSHFAMCYAGATKEIWRELFQSGTWPAHDTNSWDEEALTARVLDRVRGQPFAELGRGRWRKGDLHFVDPLDAPLLSEYRDMPRGMIRLGDIWKPAMGPAPEGAIDFIPPRFTQYDRPAWIFPAVRLYFPELGDWLDGYYRVLDETMGSAVWP